MIIYDKFEHRFPSVGEVWAFSGEYIYIKRIPARFGKCVSFAGSLIIAHENPEGLIDKESCLVLGKADSNETIDKTQQLLLIDEIKQRKKRI